MFVLRLLVFCLFICGNYGFIQKWLSFLYKCNPPETLLGKFCLGVMYNDPDENGVIDVRDFKYDLITYHWDDDLCNLDRWEMAKTLSCRYGYSKAYAKWAYSQVDLNSDGVVSAADFDFGPVPSFTPAEYLMRQYTRMKDIYCAQAEARTDPIDIKLCAEVNTLKPEDLKCE